MFMTALNNSQIDAYNASGGAQAANTDPAAAQDRFLKLFVAQLNNQDPLNPLDNAQLTSQLAQMSTVSGIEKLNAAFSQLVAQSAAGQVLQAAHLIGRQVMLPGQTEGQRVTGVAQGQGGLQLDLQGGRRVNLADVQFIS